MGGNKKYRALRLDHGNFSWGSESQYITLSFVVFIFFSLDSKLDKLLYVKFL
jgi:hypothetical protein